MTFRCYVACHLRLGMGATRERGGKMTTNLLGVRTAAARLGIGKDVL
jgi:hypothetical protein